MRQESPFWQALHAGLISPVALYAAPGNYVAYIPGPGDSFVEVNGAIAAAWLAQLKAIYGVDATLPDQQQNARTAARPLESAA